MDGAAVDAAIAAAKQDPRPSLIGCTTIIGFGAPKQGEPDMHSDALPDEEVAQTKANLEWPQEPTFYLPDDVREFCLQAVERGKRLESDDSKLWDTYAAAHPDMAAQLSAMLQGELPDGWEDALPTFDSGGSAATRYPQRPRARHHQSHRRQRRPRTQQQDDYQRQPRLPGRLL